MPVPKLKASNDTDGMKTEEGHDSLDTVIRQAIGKESSLSFSRAGDNPVQWFQLLHALDQQDLPGWPLLTPLKVQMQKCEKCSREFCSSINYRRHTRVQHRFKKLDKDSAKNRELMGIFWDKLSDDEAKEISSFKDIALEEVPGSSIIKSLTALIRKPGYPSLPQYCLRAGAALLDIIQARPSRFPLSSAELFSILDDASEKTFLCGKAASVQTYIFGGVAEKTGLETKNIVACTSFLVEQKLVKAWLTDKDAEALRCQKLLVEEEEAAQRRQAELLERKRLKKLRQKEQKTKELRQAEQADLMERIDGTVDAIPLAEQPCEVTLSDSDLHGPDAFPDYLPLSLKPCQHPSIDDDVDLNVLAGSGSGNSDPGTSHIVERRISKRSRRRQIVSRWHLSPKSRWNHVPNGFHAGHNSQVSKLGTLQRHGNHRDLKSVPAINGNRKWSWGSKVGYNGDTLKTRVHTEAISQADDEKKHEVLIGSISVTLGNCSQQEGKHFDGARDNCLPDHQMLKKNNVQDKHNGSDSSQCSTNRPTIRLWRPVSRNGIRSPMEVEHGDSESQGDGLVINDHSQSSENGLHSCSVDNKNSETGNSSPLIQDCLCTKGLQFSCQEAKAFLMERWKEAIAAHHVKLVLSPELERLEIQNDCLEDAPQPSYIKNCTLVGNVDNKLVDMGVYESSASIAARARFKTKPEKGVKLKYIPKRRTAI